MAAVETNLDEGWLGDDFQLDFTLDDDAIPEGGIAAWAITFRVASAAGVLLASAAATITSGPGGRFRVALASAVTLGAAPGVYRWEARRTDAGSRDTLAFGTWPLREPV